MGPNFSHSDVIGPEAAEVGKIMQNNGHYTIQGLHSPYQMKTLMQLPDSKCVDVLLRNCSLTHSL